MTAALAANALLFSHPARLVGLLLAGLNLLPGSGLAQENDSLEDYYAPLPVVLSASRLLQPARETPAAVTVIDRDMIEASGARQLNEVLRLVPGFYSGNLTGNSPVVAYHGLSDYYARRMQVLIDGVSIYSPLLGGVDWYELPLALQDIERIEVVRGPNAVSFGANAFLAVINIITREPAILTGSTLALNLGSGNIQDVHARTAHASDDWRYSLSIAQRRDDGFSNLPDQSRISLFNLQTQIRLSGEDELSVRLRGSGGYRQAGSAVGQGFYQLELVPSGEGNFDPERRRAVAQETTQIRWTRASSTDEELWLQYSHQERRSRETSDVILPLPGGGSMPYSYKSDYQVKRDDLEFQQARRLNESSRLVWGAQWRKDGAQSGLWLQKPDWSFNHLFRLFANMESRVQPDLALQAGAMLEHNSISGRSFSPRLALNYALTAEQSLRLGWSQANRAPTLHEERGGLVYPSPASLNWLTQGRPLAVLELSSGGLRDERIVSREIAYIAEFPRWQLGADVRAFDDRVRHLILLQASRPVVTMSNSIAWDYANSAEQAKVRGLEMSLHGQPWTGGRLQATGSYTHIDSVIPDSTKSAPATTWSLLYTQALPHMMQFSAAYYRVGSLRWQSAPLTLPHYATLDLRLAKTWKLGAQKLELAAVMRNVLGSYANYKPENQERQLSYLQMSYDF